MPTLKAPCWPHAAAGHYPVHHHPEQFAIVGIRNPAEAAKLLLPNALNIPLPENCASA